MLNKFIAILWILLSTNHFLKSQITIQDSLKIKALSDSIAKYMSIESRRALFFSDEKITFTYNKKKFSISSARLAMMANDLSFELETKISILCNEILEFVCFKFKRPIHI